MDVRVGMWRKLNTKELMLLNCGVGEDSWDSLGLQRDLTSPFLRRPVLGFLLRNYAKAESPVLWPPHSKSWPIGKKLWCWEGLGARGEGEDRGWDGWIASLTRCTWIWVNSGSWWWTGRPGVLQFMRSQRVGHDWTELNEAEVDVFLEFPCLFVSPNRFSNLISGSSTFSKSSLYIWKYSVHILVKPILKDFEHYLPSMWNEWNCAVVWILFRIALLWGWNEN